MVGKYETALPSEVPERMKNLISRYVSEPVKSIPVMARFHAEYESIHPFQDGNGRTGRLILFGECLREDLVPVVIEDRCRVKYMEGLKEYRETGSVGRLAELFFAEQEIYSEKVRYFLGGEY